MLTSTLFTAAALLLSEVSGHGAVTSYIIGGTTYPGYQGYSPQWGPPTIQRQWPSYDPILNVADPKMRCNGGTSAPLSAPVVAGQNITAIWAQWTHSQGPVMVWLYKCKGDFASCDGSGAGWFKIDQKGMSAPPLKSNNWGTDDVLRKLRWTSVIPSKIAAGNYLVRHELLALHQAFTPQFYPECAQIVITGGGGKSPTGSFLTAIPAYAAANDPGVKINTYDDTILSYTPPGPAVWS